MAASLLATKCHRPAPAPDLVARPRITGLLEQGLRGRLILVSAPAGFGKTTLVASWLAGAGRRSCWLSLDADDAAPLRFWSYLIAALQTAAPGVGQVAQTALQAPEPPPTEPILTALLNDLARLDEPLLLVLDDYHTLAAPPIHAALDLLIDRLPPQLCLLIITREDPPLALARLRARGQLTEIRAADLRFSAAEAAEFLNCAQDLWLSDADVATLAARTEGWITGLRLAALSLQHADDRPGFVAAFGASHRFLTDYLLDEVLDRQPPHRKSFLLQTAVLERLCGPLCDAVLGLADAGPAGGAPRSAYSQHILDELERANLFLVPLDNERHWYRYHHLFAEFLRLRLRESEPERVALLYRRAIAWCLAHGAERDALGYALASGAHEQAADLVEALAAPEPRAAPEAIEPPVEALSERERAILRLMAAGLSNQAIGGALYLSVNTVRWYASQIFAKLGVSGRGAAVALARRRGLI